MSLADEPTPASVRLLPWTTEEGRPAYLVTDPDGDSPISRIADEAEAAMIANAKEVMRLAFLDEHMSTSGRHELRFVIGKLRGALSDVVRIAESRGERI